MVSTDSFNLESRSMTMLQVIWKASQVSWRDLFSSKTYPSNSFILSIAFGTSQQHVGRPRALSSLRGFFFSISFGLQFFQFIPRLLISELSWSNSGLLHGFDEFWMEICHKWVKPSEFDSKNFKARYWILVIINSSSEWRPVSTKALSITIDLRLKSSIWLMIHIDLCSPK